MNDVDKHSNYQTIELQNLRQRIKELESALKDKINAGHTSENADLYMDYFHNAADLIAIIDPTGKFLEINNRFEKESGYSRNEIIGKNLATSGILTRDSAENTYKQLKKVNSGKTAPMFEIDGITKEGSFMGSSMTSVGLLRTESILLLQTDLLQART